MFFGLPVVDVCTGLVAGAAAARAWFERLPFTDDAVADACTGATTDAHVDAGAGGGASADAIAGPGAVPGAGGTDAAVAADRRYLPGVGAAGPRATLPDAAAETADAAVPADASVDVDVVASVSVVAGVFIDQSVVSSVDSRRTGDLERTIFFFFFRIFLFQQRSVSMDQQCGG